MRRNLFCLLFLFPIFLFSQTSFKGTVVDAHGNSIMGASIVISSEKSEDIIAFDITDENGVYHIEFVSEESFLSLQLRSLGYASLKEVIPNETTTKEYVLQTATTDLDEVLVKASPITQRGDTINYRVSSFANEKDRSIADVLNRLPGIEVQSNGQILYEGRPINKYYIGGLDLLEGRYDLANKNLPHKVVTNVQVLENHQPIKVLDSLEFSEHTALNIELKNNYTFTGQIEGGIGASPILWDANLTPMLFTPNKQAIVSYQSNNTGENIARQLKKLTIEDIIDQLENDYEKKDWLGIEQLASPSFSESRWLNNNTHLFSANLLHKLKDEYELRYQISYLNDYQQQEGYTNTIFYTPEDSISLLENKYNKLSYNSLDAQITLHKNTAKNYLKNELQFKSSWNSLGGSITNNIEDVEQSLSDKYFNVSNKLKTILPIGSQLLNINSYINFNQAPENLDVLPGQFSSILNDSISYNKVSQKVKLTSFYTNNYVGITKKIGAFTLSPKLGFQWEKQGLESFLEVDNNTLSSTFVNDLNWERSKTYFHLQSQFRKGKWRMEFQTPLNLHTYRIIDKQLDLGQNFNRVTWEPRLSLTNDINAHWKFRSAIGIHNNFGSIDKVYYAYVLQNYRNLQRMRAPLLEVLNKSFSSGLTYRNPIQALFGNLMYTYQKGRHNLLYDNIILSDGAVEVNAVLRNNTRENHKFSGRLSKYLSALRTNFTLVMEHNIKSYQTLLNHKVTDIANNSSRYTTQLEVDFTDWFDVEYYGVYSTSNNKIQNQPNRNTRQHSHRLHLNLNLFDSNHLGIKTEYIANYLSGNKQQNVFSDIFYRHSIKEKSLDFEFHLTNIFGANNYRRHHFTDFSYIETNYTIRPRQILFKVRMSI